MLPALQASLEAELQDLASRARLRQLPPLAGASRTQPSLGTASLLSFSSNDYLGLACHPALAAAATTATASHAFGAAASRLVSGDLPPHRALEDALARYLGTEACLLFPTGYQANLGVLTALAGRDDLIVSDALNHASLIDGCRLSRATVRVYPHGDLSAARALLTSAEARAARRRILVSESVFSMDGDLAPVPALAELAGATNSALILDEAHAVGVLGPRGRGLAAAASVQPDALVGTLGKAFGGFGGFVAGSKTLRATLVNRARSFIFTTAPPPSLPAAAHAALGLIDSPAGDELRARLAANIERLTAALPPAPQTITRPPVPTPIVPFVLGADSVALSLGERLRTQGLFVQPIRPPTVPEGTARLRITVSAAHSPAEIDQLTTTLHHLLSHP